MREFYGKGAARSRTTISDEYVFVVLEDVLTTAEMTLRNGGAGELVRKVRMRFEDVMTATFVGEVERLTGRTVVAYHSQVVLEPPSCFEIFVLDPTQEGIGAPEHAGEPVEAGDLQRTRTRRGRRSAALAGRAVRARQAHADRHVAAASRRRASRRHLQRGHAPDERALRPGGRADAHVRHRRARLLCHGGGADRGRAHPRRGWRDRARARAAHPVHADGPPRVRRRGRSAARAPGAGHGVPARLRPGHAVPHLRPRRRARAASRPPPPGRSPKPTASDRGSGERGRYHPPPVVR